MYCDSQLIVYIRFLPPPSTQRWRSFSCTRSTVRAVANQRPWWMSARRAVPSSRDSNWTWITSSPLTLISSNQCRELQSTNCCWRFVDVSVKLHVYIPKECGWWGSAFFSIEGIVIGNIYFGWSQCLHQSLWIHPNLTSKYNQQWRDGCLYPLNG